MLYYTFTLKRTDGHETDDNYRSTIAAVVDEANISLDNKAIVYVNAMLTKGKSLSGCAAINDYSVKLCDVIKPLCLGLENTYALDKFSETTFQVFDSLSDTALRKDLASKEKDGPFSDDLSYIFRRSLAHESIIKPLTDTGLRKQLKAMSYIEGIKEEISRIFSVKGRPEKGNPVHYIITADNPDDRSSIRNLLLSALLKQNRIRMGRLIEITGNTLNDVSTEEISSLIDLEIGGTIILRLDKFSENTNTLNALHAAIDEIAPIIMEKKRNVLFIIELSGKNENGLEYMKSLLKSIIFVEIKERILTFDESCAFLSSLAEKDGLDDKQSLLELLDKSSYSIADLKSIYSEWYDKELCSTIYPAYADLRAIPNKIQKEADGTAYQKLSRMIGLDEVRKVIIEAINFSRIQNLYKENGVMSSSYTRHMVFTGNPGTAKTTCARLFASIMKENGLLTRGHLIEVGRQDIVSKYLGGTAPLIKQFFEKAEGGVLFIDEAYSLVDGDRGLYGDEAINTIVQLMESKRDSVVVILAGYPDEMEAFLSRNPGLRSRIGFQVHFRDYTAKELVTILKLFADESGMRISEAAAEKAYTIFEAAMYQRDFGNGRFVRNIFDKARLRQASRILDMSFPSADDIKLIDADDLPEPEERKEERRIGFVI